MTEAERMATSINESLSHVCECSGWTPPASIQEELRSVLERSRITLEAADRIDDLTAKLDQYRSEYFTTMRERDELAADKEVLLGHMSTIRNCTNDPAIASLTNVVLERMAQGGMK